MAEWTEVIDDRSDEALNALKRCAELIGADIDTPEFKRRDFSNSEWKPYLKIDEQLKFPYHAYAIDSKQQKKKEGEYEEIDHAQNCARDLAQLLNTS